MFGFLTSAMHESFDKLFQGMMDNIASLPKPVPWRSRGKGRGLNNGLLSLHRSISRQSNPAGPRKWHNLEDLHQQDALGEAAAKRVTRAAKRQDSYDRGLRNNPCRYTPIGRCTGMQIGTGMPLGAGTLSIAPAGLR